MNSLYKAGRIHAFMLFTPNSHPTFWIKIQQTGNIFPVLYFPILVSLHQLSPHFPVRGWLEWLQWTSAAEACLLQGWTCRAFRDAVQHSLVATSGCLSFCCLSIISNQSAYSPLTSHINKPFLSTELPLPGYFLFFFIHLKLLNAHFFPILMLWVSAGCLDGTYMSKFIQLISCLP